MLSELQSEFVGMVFLGGTPVHRYQTFEEAQAHLQTFLEEVCNAKRLPSSLDYLHPDELEATYLKC